MIEKIITIKGIGLLHDAITRAKNCSKITIIYGENGRGKSTLATIFSSLAQNNSSIIFVRKTLDGSNNPEVELRINNIIYRYNNGNWNQICNTIVVFDSSFVNANVYSGFEITSDQRRSLLVFTLGELGVKLKNKVDFLTEKISEITSEIRNRNTELVRICYPLSVRDYINITEDLSIDEKIDALESFYQSVLRADKIVTTPILSEILLSSPNLNDVKLLLSTTLTEISREAKSKVLQHMATHMNEQNEQWIKEGLSLMKGDNCPFCAQNLDESVQLIELYQKYFDESYQEHQDKLQEYQDNINRCFSDSALLQFSQICDKNALLFNNEWKELLKCDFDNSLSGNKIERDLKDIRESVKKILQLKIAQPANVIEDLEIIDTLYGRYLDILDQIKQYNDTINSLNGNIETIKNKLKQASRQQMSSDLHRLKIQKERYSSSNNELCDKFVSLSQEKESLERQKEGARTQLESFTNELLRNYEGEINRYLECFNAGFRIVNIDTSHERGHPRMRYQLQIRNQYLGLGSRDSPDFTNTLSDGDKRTLAFSFFMAKNNLDTNISNKILIIDDPMSSFDQSRQRATQLALTRLAQKANQIIILSHDPNFLKSFIETFAMNQEDLLIYELIRTQNDYSILEECDIDECIQSYYKNSYQLISKYIRDPRDIDKLSVVRAIRPMIEANLKLRFQDSFKGSNSLGKMISLIRSSANGSPLTKIKPHLQKIEDINSYTTEHTHDINAEGSLDQIIDIELKRYAKLAMDIVQGF